MRLLTSCVPRHATPRDPDSVTDGALAAVHSRLLGRRMPPWARAAADVIGEQDDAGHYRYPVCVVLVPRQSAKTTTALDIALGRGMTYRDYRGAYTAQTGHVVTRRMGERMDAVALSPLVARVKPRRSQGTERIGFPARGSFVMAFPPKDGALRSEALDVVIVDEAQEHDDDPLGVALDHTIMPTFTTRPRRQLIVLGTAPNRAGTMLARYRRLALSGAPGIAVVDYGATPEDDLADPAVWRRVHPGLEAGLTDEAFLRSQLELDPEGFAREHMNVWPEDGEGGGVIPGGPWRACRHPDPDRLDVLRPTAHGLAVAVSRDAARTSLGTAYRDVDGRLLVKVVDERPGTGWVVDAARTWQARTRLPVVADAVGPAGPVVDALKTAGVGLDIVTTDGYARACAALLADIVEDGGRLWHLGQPVLDLAAATTGRRPLSERWAWARRGPDVAALECVTLAAAYARSAPARPRIR